MEQRQLAYELHKPKRKNFKTIAVEVKEPNESWQADLVDMTHLKKWNKNNTFILTVIDTFSKFAYARALKSKNASDVRDAFEDILLNATTTPIHLQTDAGKEFFNSLFKKLMARFEINHYHTFSDKKASIVERFQRTLKSRMYRGFTETNSLQWLSILPQLIDQYNRSKHRTINAKPIDVTLKNAKMIHKNIIASRKKGPPRKRKFHKGDIVRVSRQKNIFAKGYSANWTEELFEISNVQMTKPITYKLQDLLGVPIRGTFYSEEIQRTQIPQYARIEKVIRKKRGADGKMLARVKWKGYDARFNEWIPLSKTKKL